MRIGIDARELTGHPTGVGRYLAELMREWQEMAEARRHEFVLFTPAPLATPEAHSAGKVVLVPGRGTWWEQVDLPRAVRRAGVDVLFAPAYSGPVMRHTPLVVAIHDVSFSAHPEWFRWKEGLKRRILTRRAANGAARVITSSEFSKREIVDRFGLPDTAIEVIYPGVSSIPAPRSQDPSADPAADAPGTGARILFVGSIFNRRHVPELLAAFARLAQRHHDLDLDIVGENRTFPFIDIERARQETGVPHRVHVADYVPEQQLASLYSRASAFAFLSEYEGFGLTPLEALRAGIPVVLLDTPVAREVCRDAAVYVSRPEPALVEEALERLLFDTALRTQLLRRVPTLLAQYPWRTCAERTLAVLTAAC
jgi:glycosyltransferase involved in cell wall biosynthesis